MKTMRSMLAVGATLLLASQTALASDPASNFPDRHMTLIVPYSAGGGTDAVARTIARALSDKWGQSVVVENRTGADGVIGTQRVLQQPADGYTMMIQLNSMLLYEWLHKATGIKALQDLTPISKIQESPLTLVVGANHPANNLQELFAHCKQTGTCSYGTATANGRLVGRQIEQISGVPMQAVPYKGTSAMVTDVVGGHLEIGMFSANLAAPLLNDGKIKALTVGTDYRFPSMPNVPTFFEATGQNINGTTWYGLFVKNGTPEPIVQKLEQAIMEIANDETVRKAIVSQGATPLFSKSEQFKKDLQQEHAQVTVIADQVF